MATIQPPLAVNELGALERFVERVLMRLLSEREDEDARYFAQFGERLRRVETRLDSLSQRGER